MTEDAVQELIEKNPVLKPARDKLLQMQPGRYCIHQSWGFGQIKDYQEAENRVIIDFQDKAGHSMDPAFCANTMEILPDDHLLVRQQTEPEAIEEMISRNPAELVKAALKQFPNHAATGVELESMLTRVLGPKKFKRWWTTAKRHLAKDPHVAVPAKKTECYYIREQALNAEHEILEHYESTQSAKRKIRLARDIIEHSGNRPDLHDSLGQMLDDLGHVIAESNQITLAERLQGAWIRDDLANIVGRDATTLEPSSGSMISDAADLSQIAESLPSNQQKRLLVLVKETYPGEWKPMVFDLLKNSRGKFTTECINFLLENNCEEELAATLRRWLNEQNLRAPVLHWIVKNRNSRKFANLMTGLISPRLLNAIFFAIDYEALQLAGSRKIVLAELLHDDRELIRDLLLTADTEIARDLANNLLANQGFEELAKKSLLARFIKHFPSVQSLVSGEVETERERLIVSRESYDRRGREYEEIVSKRIPENSKAIATAMEHGDLRENSEYKMAKQDQQMLLARKANLERDLSRAEITDFSGAPADQVGIGSVVGLRQGSTNRKVVYSILGAWDSDPENNILSYKTPLSQSLLGRKTGETIEVQIGDSTETWTIESIDRYLKEE